MFDEIDKANKCAFNFVMGLIVGIMLILMLPFELFRVLIGKAA